MLKRFGISFLAVAAFASLAVANALATSYNLDGASTAVQSQFSSSLPAALLVGGSLLGVMVAWRFIRRIVKA